MVGLPFFCMKCHWKGFIIETNRRWTQPKRPPGGRAAAKAAHSHRWDGTGLRTACGRVGEGPATPSQAEWTPEQQAGVWGGIWLATRTLRPPPHVCSRGSQTACFLPDACPRTHSGRTTDFKAKHKTRKTLDEKLSQSF